MVIKRPRIFQYVQHQIKLNDCFAMLVTLLRLEERDGEHVASGYAKALNSITADDEWTQIL